MLHQDADSRIPYDKSGRTEPALDAALSSLELPPGVVNGVVTQTQNAGTTATFTHFFENFWGKPGPITARILEGLDYAHRKGEGVIHRDLSPRNVMLSRDGEVKLVDFGIAVTLGDEGDAEAHQSAPTGSFPYMSPSRSAKNR